jgi:hypothetical protein
MTGTAAVLPTGESVDAEPDAGGRYEPRFRALLGASNWMALPMPVRRRLAKLISGTTAAVYVGEVIETRMSFAGWLLAQAARLIGGPLPISRDAKTASVVTVTEDVAGQGQHWTRLYARHRGFPQVIRTSKRFAGPTGLEEYIGCGLGMALTVDVEHGLLSMRAAHYFLQIWRWRLMLPGWASPGALAVTQLNLDDGRFRFTLRISHPQLGSLIEQTAVFQEVQP